MLVTTQNPTPLRSSTPQLQKSCLNGQGGQAPPSKEEFIQQFFGAEGNLKPEYQKVVYDDGGEYIGQYLECRHGKGMYSFPNRDIYLGSWKDDKFSGDGLYESFNGDKYQGKFF